MSLKLKISPSYDYKPELQGHNADKWLQDALETLDARNVQLKLGAKNTTTTYDSQDLAELFGMSTLDASETLRVNGNTVYLNEIKSFIDDILANTHVQNQVFDLRIERELAQALRIGNSHFDYALDIEKAKLLAPNYDLVPVITAAMMGKEPASPSRDFSENETVLSITGLSSEEMVKLLSATRGSRRVVDRMRKVDAFAAFSFAHDGIDSIDWSERAFEARESVPYFQLGIENNRREWDAENGEWGVDYGTDYNEDVYYKGFRENAPNDDILARSNKVLRHRIRRNSPEEVRRTLVQVKTMHGVDEDGQKIAHKIDERYSSSETNNHEAMANMVRTGTRRGEAVRTISHLFHQLNDEGYLKNEAGESEGVVFQPASVVQSKRSRFHHTCVGQYQMQVLLNYCRSNVEYLKSHVPTNTSLSSQSKKDFTNAIEDFSDENRLAIYLQEHVDTEGLNQKVDATQIGSILSGQINDRAPTTLAYQHVLAKGFKELSDTIHDYSNQYAATIAETENYDDAFDLVDELRLHLRDSNPSSSLTTIGRSGTLEIPLSDFDEILAISDEGVKRSRAWEVVSKFSEWLVDAEGNDILRTLTQDDAIHTLEAIRAFVMEEHIKILGRQAATAGSMSKGLYFDQLARSMDAGPSSSDFTILTFDQVRYFEPDEWEKLTTDEQRWQRPIENAEAYHGDVVVECQVESNQIARFTRARLKAERKNFLLYIACAKAAKDEGWKIGDGPISKALLRKSFEDVRESIFNFDASKAGVATKEDLLNVYLREVEEVESQNVDYRSELSSAIQSKFNDFQMPKMNAGTINTKEFLEDLNLAPIDVEQILFEETSSRFLMDQLKKTTDTLAGLARRKVRREARRAGFDVEWEPATSSKGEKAISLLPA